MRKNGYVTKNEVKSAISGFVDEVKSDNNIKLLTFVFMGHGSENDWLVLFYNVSWRDIFSE